MQGRGRSFRNRHPELFQGNTRIQSDGSGRDLPIAIVNQREAEIVRKRFIALFMYFMITEQTAQLVCSGEGIKLS